MIEIDKIKKCTLWHGPVECKDDAS